MNFKKYIAIFAILIFAANILYPISSFAKSENVKNFVKADEAKENNRNENHGKSEEHKNEDHVRKDKSKRTYDRVFNNSFQPYLYTYEA